MEWENAELRGQLLGVTQERDSALRKSQGLQSKLESLEQVLKVRRLWTWREGLGPWHKEKVGECVLCGALRSEVQSRRRQALCFSGLGFLFNRGYLEPIGSEARSP